MRGGVGTAFGRKRLNVIVYAIPVFVALMAAEFGIGLALGRNVYRLNDAIGSLTAGILSQISGVFMLALSVGIYVLVYNHFALFSLAASDWRVWVGALVAYDFFYYWNHRIDHEVGLFWAAHVVHHQSEAFNLSTALRQPSSGVLLGWIFYLPMAIAGVPPVVFVAVGLIDLLYQFWIHTELVGKLGWFDRIFASPSNHRVHHGVNDQSLDENYGGILIIWDRLFGTYEDEVEPPVYGVRGGLGTFDPISANVAYYRTMLDLCRRATDRRDKIRVWFAPPGWVPANLRPSGPPRYDPKAIRLYDPAVSRAASILALAALVAMIGATAAFLVAAPHLPLANGIGVFLSLMAALWAMGSLVDGRISICEALYVFAAASTCAAFALDWPLVPDVMKPLAMALLVLAFALRGGTKGREASGPGGARGVADRRHAAAPDFAVPAGPGRLSRGARLLHRRLFPRRRLPALALGAGGNRRVRRPRAHRCLAGGLSGPQGAGRGLCRRDRTDGGAGDWARDRASHGRRGCGRRRGVDLHAVRQHDRARQIRQCRLAGRSMDAADLLSRAGSDRLLCAAARAPTLGPVFS